MANSRSGGSDGDTIEAEKKGSSFFSRRKSLKADTAVEPSEKGSESTTETEPAKQDLPPVSFSELFRCVLSLLVVEKSLIAPHYHARYSTRFEIILNIIGTIAACAAGAAMVRSIARPH